MIWGGGPHVRVYCVFDEDAITKDGLNEDALPKSPTEGDWRMSIPFLAEDVAWSCRQPCRRVEQGYDAIGRRRGCGRGTAAPHRRRSLSINLSEFLKS